MSSSCHWGKNSQIPLGGPKNTAIMVAEQTHASSITKFFLYNCGFLHTTLPGEMGDDNRCREIRNLHKEKQRYIQERKRNESLDTSHTKKEKSKSPDKEVKKVPLILVYLS